MNSRLKEFYCMKINDLCDIVRETSFDIHCFLRQGHFEKVYENALAHRLRKNGFQLIQQHPLNVYDQDGTELGSYVADLFVDERLIVELKACKCITDEHIAQILGYLKASRIENGLLINFGAPKLQIKSLSLINGKPVI